MSPLAGAVLSLLEAQATYPPLAAASIGRVLWVTGKPGEARQATVEEIEAALGELMQAGGIERVWRKGLACYRVTHNRQVGSVKG